MRTRIQSGEQGYVLVTSLIMVILISSLIAYYLSVSASSLTLTGSTQEHLQTLLVAETGLAAATHEMNASKETGNPVDTSKFSDLYARPDGAEVGYYHVEYEVLDPAGETLANALRVRLKSTGVRDFDRDGAGIPLPGTGRRRAVEVVLTYGPEPDLTKAILTDEDLVIGGDLNVEGDVHTNGQLTGNGNSGLIADVPDERLDLANQPAPTPDSFKGNLTASMGGLDSVAFTVEGPIQNGAADPIMIPELDPYELRAQALQKGWEVEVRTPGPPTYTEKWQNANDYKSLTSDPSTPGKMIFVKGNVSIKGNITGDVVIVATGNVECAGNALLANETCSLMIYAGGDIKIGGTFNVQGILYARGDIKSQGTPTIDGLILAGGTGTFGGTVNVNYTRPTPDQQQLMKKWRLISWREVGPKADAIP
ncbi:MAG: hypothetical protein AB1696_20220 [Planctomycetota bacterium]